MIRAPRSVALPEGIAGRLLLSAMPGRNEPLADFLAATRDVSTVVCLVSSRELEEKSPEYAKLVSGKLPWAFRQHAIADFGVATDEAAYAALVASVVEELRAGRTVLVHCAAGVGRTGTFAGAVLVRLGETLEDALVAIHRAGSMPETAQQRGALAPKPTR